MANRKFLGKTPRGKYAADLCVDLAGTGAQTAEPMNGCNMHTIFMKSASGPSTVKIQVSPDDGGNYYDLVTKSLTTGQLAIQTFPSCDGDRIRANVTVNAGNAATVNVKWIGRNDG